MNRTASARAALEAILRRMTGSRNARKCSTGLSWQARQGPAPLKCAKAGTRFVRTRVQTMLVQWPLQPTLRCAPPVERTTAAAPAAPASAHVTRQIFHHFAQEARPAARLTSARRTFTSALTTHQRRAYPMMRRILPRPRASLHRHHRHHRLAVRTIVNVRAALAALRPRMKDSRSALKRSRGPSAQAVRIGAPSAIVWPDTLDAQTAVRIILVRR